MNGRPATASQEGDRRKKRAETNVFENREHYKKYFITNPSPHNVVLSI
jgi:hypothetical protein